MSDRNKCLIVVLALLLAGSVSAKMSLNRELSYDIPGLDGEVKAVCLQNIDALGWPEVLATDLSKLVLAGNLGDQVVYQLDLDSVFAEAGYLYLEYCLANPKLVLADVNRDSLPDAVMMAGVLRLCIPDLIGPVIVFVDNILSPQPQVYLFDMTWPQDGGPGLLSAFDYDCDGYPELTLSADSADISWDPVCLFADRYGRTLTYYSFPDSLLSCRTRYLVRRMPLELSDHTVVFVATQDSSSARACYQEPSYIEGLNQVVVLDNLGVASASLRGTVPAFCTGNCVEDVYSLYRAGCVGNIDDRDTRPDIVSSYYWQRTCIDTTYGSHTTFDTLDYYLVLQRVVAADSLEEVWRVRPPTRYLSYFCTHSNFPGSFVAIDPFLHTLYRFSGRTGGVREQLAGVPEDILFWGRPFGDDDIISLGGPDYLVTLDSATLSFYSLRETTDVDDPAPTTLPSSLVLGQPYPNPFNPSVTVPITLPHKGRLRVEVFNVLGQAVGVLYDGKAGPGDMDVVWDASEFSSGVYFFKVIFDDLPKTVSAVLVK